jgi:hypothetical protein
MPTGQALQVFHGTLPLVFVLGGIYLRQHTMLKDILARLGKLEEGIGRVEEKLGKVVERLAGVYSEVGAHAGK